MILKPKSIRPFIGAKDYELKREFYRDLGFEEFVIFHTTSLFTTGEFAFYLQDAFVKDWVDNTMVFLEVDNVQEHLEQLKQSGLIEKYKNIKCSEIVYND